MLEARGVASDGYHPFQEMNGRWQVPSLRDERAHGLWGYQGNDRAALDGRCRPQEVNTPGQARREVAGQARADCAACHGTGSRCKRRNQEQANQPALEPPRAAPAKMARIQ